MSPRRDAAPEADRALGPSGGGAGRGLARLAAAGWGAGALLLAAHSSGDPRWLGRYSDAFASVLLGWLALGAMLALLGAWVRRSPRRARVWAGRIVLASTTCVAALLLAELALRLLNPMGVRYFPEMGRLPRRAAPPPLQYELVPETRRVLQDVEVRISPDGFRDDSLDPPHPIVPRRRILALGDSVTFGWGVPAEETWPEQLEAWFAEQAGAGPVEVVNMGVPSYNTRQEAALLAARGWAASPEAILLLVVPNDLQGFYRDLPRNRLGRLRAWVSDRLLYRTCLGGLLVRWQASARAARGQATATVESVAAEPGWRGCRDALEEIVAACRSRGLPFACLFWGWQQTPRRHAIATLLAETCAAHGAVFRDLAADLPAARLEAMTLSVIDRHPNAAGHRWIAEQAGLALVVAGFSSDAAATPSKLGKAE